MAENVGGFAFTDEDLASLAKKELEGVSYVRSKLDMGNPESVLAVYQKMIRGRMFQTQIGTAFLYELQTYLKEQPDIDKRAIIPIPVLQKAELTESPTQVKELQKKLGEQKKWVTASVAGVFIMMAALVVMLVVAASSGSTTILNYENNIIDKYSQWEQELSEREEALRLEKENLKWME